MRQLNSRLKHRNAALCGEVAVRDAGMQALSVEVHKYEADHAWLGEARRIMKEAGRTDFLTTIGKHIVDGKLPMKSYRSEVLENEAKNGWRTGKAAHGARYSGVSFTLALRAAPMWSTDAVNVGHYHTPRRTVLPDQQQQQY